MKKLRLYIALVFVSFSFGSMAQQDEQMSLYLYNKLYINPAYAGSRDALSAIAIARFQWVDFEGAPKTQWFSVHAPLLQKSLGIGAHMVNDQIGARSRTASYVDLSGSVVLNKNESRLAAGISGGFDMISYDFSNLNVYDQNDPYYGSSFSTFKPNLGAGLYYYGKKHYLSLSVPRVFEASEEFSTDSITQLLNSRHYFVSAGYLIDLNSVFKLQPSLLFKFTPHVPFTIDANVSLHMYDKITTGIMYRYNESMGINCLYHLKNTFSIGYVYDFPINGLRTYQYGSHELFLRYDFKPKNSTYTSPRYF